MRVDHSYAPNASADWKVTPGSLSTAFRALVPAASRPMASLFSVWTWRLWPWPMTMTASTSEASAGAAAAGAASYAALASERQLRLVPLGSLRPSGAPASTLYQADLRVVSRRTDPYPLAERPNLFACAETTRQTVTTIVGEAASCLGLDVGGFPNAAAGAGEASGVLVCAKNESWQ